MSLLQDYPYLKTVGDMAKAKKLQLFLVGGFLRDFFFNAANKNGTIRQLKDFDFTLSSGALKFAKSFAVSIKGTYVLLDEERHCARVCKKTKEGLLTFDFADFRAKTFKGDLESRDFSINTLSVKLDGLRGDVDIKDALLDVKGGLKDLKRKRISMVSPKAFKDDPLRILRAYSLKAQLGFSIESKTLARMKKDKELLYQVSPERLRDELFKVLASKNAGEILKIMSRDKILEIVLPQVKVMYNCPQGTYHHLDVWPHSLEVVCQLDQLIPQWEQDPDCRQYLQETLAGERKRLHLMRLAALMHDVGKPQTRAVENGKVSFHGHEHVGKNIVRSMARELKISTKERHIFEDIVRWHLRPGYLSNFKKPGERAIFRYFRDTKEEAVSILLVSLADQRSTCGPATTEYDQQHHERICVSLINQYFAKRQEKPFVRFINGDDLIRRLKLKPSKLFGRILTEVEEQQHVGKLTSKEEALELAQKIAEGRPS